MNCNLIRIKHKKSRDLLIFLYVQENRIKVIYCMTSISPHADILFIPEKVRHGELEFNNQIDFIYKDKAGNRITIEGVDRYDKRLRSKFKNKIQIEL